MTNTTAIQASPRRLLACSLLMAAFAVAIRSTCFAQPASTSAGTVSAVQGDVNIARSGATLPVAYGMALSVGDRVTTGPHGRVTVTLKDGTQLELAESTTLVLTEERTDAAGHRLATRLDLLGGLVHSLVRFAPGIAPNYEVHTPNAVAAARGTTYDTDYAKGVERKGFGVCREFTDVAVFDGNVAVSNPTNASAGVVDVRSGHRTTVPCGLAPLAALAVSSAATTGTSAATIAGGAMLGGSLAGAAVVGGLGGAGALGGNSPTSPSQ